MSPSVEGPLLTIECNGKVIEVWKGDITSMEIEAIVNPANSLMIMGGGVAGAIRRAAGDEVEREARRFAPVPVGEAVVTSAGRLQPRIKVVIHAPTMERPAMRTTVEKVKKATKAALKTAAEKGIQAVALPAMGAGVGGVPVKDVVEAMLQTIIGHWRSSEKPLRIVLVAYTDTDLKQFEKAIDEFLTKHRECTRR